MSLGVQKVVRLAVKKFRVRMARLAYMHKVVLIGDSAVGKTSIVGQYVYGSCSWEHRPTVGIDFLSKDCVVDDLNVRFQIWDTAGQERFHALIPSYIRNSTVAFLIFDLTSRVTFENLQKWHQAVTNVASPGMIVIGNKVDLESERQVDQTEAQRFAAQIGAEYIETSARTAVNIDELFKMAALMPVPEVAKRPEDTNDTPIVVTVDVGKRETGESGSYTCPC